MSFSGYQSFSLKLSLNQMLSPAGQTEVICSAVHPQHFTNSNCFKNNFCKTRELHSVQKKKRESTSKYICEWKVSGPKTNPPPVPFALICALVNLCHFVLKVHSQDAPPMFKAHYINALYNDNWDYTGPLHYYSHETQIDCVCSCLKVVIHTFSSYFFFTHSKSLLLLCPLKH